MFVLNIPNFSIRHVYESCQDLSIRPVFGFEREGYLFFKGEDMCKVEQVGQRFLFSCDEEKFYDSWFDFFDLSTDYAELNGVARRSRSEISVAARSGSGIHVLRQDPWECIVKEFMFLKSSPNVAKSRLDSIREASTEEKGKTLKGYGYIRWRPIPNPDQLESSLELLDWFCDSETLNRCVSLIEWSKCHRELLVNPESHSEFEVSTELMKLLNDEHVVRRIEVYGFHFHWIDVTSKKQSALLERQTGVDSETLIEYEFGDWRYKSAYAGTLLARRQALKNKVK